MLQLNPSDKLPIIRQLNNPNDNTGYYVRAVVRNSLLQTVLKTIDLTDVGGGRFESSYQVPPADGTYFDITTKVYSDAGYTTQDTIYADENNQYLGALRWGLQYWNAGGGADIDYKRIEKIVEKEVSKITTLSQEEVSNVVTKASDEIQRAIESTRKAVNDIVIPEVKIPEQKEVNFDSVENKIQEAISLIEELKNETGEKIDDTNEGIMTALTGISTDNEAMLMTVLKNQEEKGTSELQLAKERDMYKEQLLKIRKSIGNIESEYPEMKPDMEEDESEEENAQKEMELRVKNYTK